MLCIDWLFSNRVFAFRYNHNDECTDVHLFIQPMAGYKRPPLKGGHSFAAMRRYWMRRRNVDHRLSF